ncbi:MAG: nicotinate phosphoribosyltransferase [Bacteroidales bacterium]|jgi:nicotinate phosphoribosyltransferase|nr:nicotinate phosphoribosyltransferase [Bacteroidales bacterium]MDD4383691.1 nicotinate phosphoribosyltransferase [Bacteroidales bacterium]MDY0196222.1 nicotinate phosphoribosyltransferase [Tenuifilaceae bacterium]
MIDFTASYTDQYELTMAYAYFEKGRHNEKAVFDYFFRKLPFEGGYAVFAGLDNLLNILETFRFDSKDLSFLSHIGFKQHFIDYLKDFKFTGNIYSCLEGEIVFPTSPILQVEGNIIEAQIIETILLNILNFQTLIATKASRMRQVAGNRQLIDFGLRRAQGVGGYHASRAAYIGGFNSTSNVRAGRDFGIPVSGTMAHSFVQSYDDEITAFRDYANAHPNDCVLLIDTYNTLENGVPNAIIVGKEMEANGHKLNGIRLDSGDLAYLAKKSRKMLDNAGLSEVKIAVSNQLDEVIIKSLLEQEAPIDVFGVGTSLVTGYPDAALDGVYKLAFSNDKPRIKISENISKTTLPSKKQVYRFFNPSGQFAGIDAIALKEQKNLKVIYHPFDPHKKTIVEGCAKTPLLQKVMEGGKRITGSLSLDEISSYSRERLNILPAEYKRFNNPHIYKVGISEELKNQRDSLIALHKNP